MRALGVRLALLAAAASSAGCVHMAPRPPAIAGDAGLAEREAFYQRWKLVPRRTWLGVARWSRGDGEYDWDALGNLTAGEPSLQALWGANQRSQLELMAGVVGFGLVDGLVIINPVFGLYVPEVLAAERIAADPVAGAQEPFAEAYDGWMRGRLGLSASAYAGDGRMPPRRDPAAGDLVPVVRVGASLATLRDVEAAYGFGLTPVRRSKTRTVLVNQDAELGLGVALARGLAVEAAWAPILSKGVDVDFPGNYVARWDLSAEGAVVRGRWTAWRNGRDAVSVTGGPAWFRLLGAGVSGNWFTGALAFAGRAWGGVASVEFDRRFADRLSEHLGIGYRWARITDVTVSGIVDGAAVPPQRWLNADGGPAAVDHSGPTVDASVRFRF